MRENSLEDVDGNVVKNFEFFHVDTSGKEPVTRRVEVTIFRLRHPVKIEGQEMTYAMDMNGVILKIPASPAEEEILQSWNQIALPQFNLRLY